jgi:hypothetical protein
MIKKHGFLLAVLTACFAPVTGLGGLIGEPAAPLVVKEWIKGQPVEAKAGTNILVVEIFTTTSLSSWAVITNVNEVQRRFKDKGVVVVGVSDEPADEIKEFLAHEGAAIEYAIAADDGRQTARGYMAPLGQQGVPHAFVVGKDGKLLWHGHPLAGLEEALEEITAGRYNMEEAAKKDMARTQVEQYVMLARRNDPRAGPAGRRYLATWATDVGPLCDLAFGIATDRSIKKPDLPLATEALERAEKLAGTNSTHVAVTRAIFLFETGRTEEGLARAKEALAAAQGQKDKARAETCLSTMTGLLAAGNTNKVTQKDPARTRMEEYVKLARGNDPKAGAAGRELLGMLTNNVAQLCDLALEIAMDPRIAKRDLALASAALAQAQKVAPTNSTRVALTEAMLLFESGKRDEGMARARQALAAAPGAQEKANAEAYLRAMEARLKAATTNQTEGPAGKP